MGLIPEREVKMTKQDMLDQIEFVSKLYEETPDGALDKLAPGSLRQDANELMRLARRHGRLQERRCNEDLGMSGERADARLEARIEKLIEQPSMASIKRVLFGGDPRGFTVKVFLTSGDWNTWGGKENGWGVPQ